MRKNRSVERFFLTFRLSFRNKRDFIGIFTNFERNLTSFVGDFNRIVAIFGQKAADCGDYTLFCGIFRCFSCGFLTFCGACASICVLFGSLFGLWGKVKICPFPSVNAFVLGKNCLSLSLGGFKIFHTAFQLRFCHWVAPLSLHSIAHLWGFVKREIGRGVAPPRQIRQPGSMPFACPRFS